MEIGFIFWLLMLLSILFFWWGNFTPQGVTYWPRGNGLLLFVLLFLLGWKVFGFAIHQ